MNGLFNPTLRLLWSALAAVGVAVMIAADTLTRPAGEATFLAPTAPLLWLSVALGYCLGLAGVLWERYMLCRQRAFMLAFYSAPLPERLRWRYQRGNLIYSGWFLLAFLALLGWCVYARVFALPAIWAVVAVLLAGNRCLARDFHADLQRMRERLQLDPALEALIRARLHPREQLWSCAQRQSGEIIVHLLDQEIQPARPPDTESISGDVAGRTLLFRLRDGQWSCAAKEDSVPQLP